MSDAPHFRRSKRQAMSLQVLFRRDAEGAALDHIGSTGDLSVDGAFIETRTPPPVGTWLRLSLRSPTAWDPLEIRAEVRWVATDPDTPGFGIRFDRLKEAEARALYALIAASAFHDEP
ncbi:MAG: PilZ domain-containing protein [Myxococcota bacterium]